MKAALVKLLDEIWREPSQAREVKRTAEHAIEQAAAARADVEFLRGRIAEIEERLNKVEKGEK